MFQHKANTYEPGKKPKKRRRHLETEVKIPKWAEDYAKKDLKRRPAGRIDPNLSQMS